MKKLLLVDDEIYIFNIFKHFSKNNFIVDYAPDGRRGLSLFNRNNYDLVITDLTMPKMDGMELSRQFTKIRPDIPIILFTGYNEVIPPETREALGIREVLFKPVSSKILASSIRRIIDRNE